jgi:predicted RNA-binding Zn ribbon-like protein
VNRLPHFVAGNLALDLANSVSWRGTEREVDHLPDAKAALAWAAAQRLVDGNFVVEDPAVLLSELHALRAAIGSVGEAIASGRAAPQGGLIVICNMAAQSLARAEPIGAPLDLRFADRDRIIGPIAWAALDLLRGGELGRLKQCPPDDCRWLFIDRTKNGSRRWCDMGTCGNRAKKRKLG